MRKSHISGKKGTPVIFAAPCGCHPCDICMVWLTWHADNIDISLRWERRKRILARKGPIAGMLVTSTAKTCNDDLCQNSKRNSCDQGHPFQFGSVSMNRADSPKEQSGYVIIKKVNPQILEWKWGINTSSFNLFLNS